MKLFKLTYIFGFIWLTGCNDQPTKLSGKYEIIEVSYMNWACDCADFIDTKYFKENPDYEVQDEDCIFIEPLNNDKKIPENYYSEGYFEYNVVLIGQFYEDKGVPVSYDRKTPEKPEKAAVFRYDSFQLVKKK